jgi:hypothetical protein
MKWLKLLMYVLILLTAWAIPWWPPNNAGLIYSQDFSSRLIGYALWFPFTSFATVVILRGWWKDHCEDASLRAGSRSTQDEPKVSV